MIFTVSQTLEFTCTRCFNHQDYFLIVIISVAEDPCHVSTQLVLTVKGLYTGVCTALMRIASDLLQILAERKHGADTIGK